MPAIATDSDLAMCGAPIGSRTLSTIKVGARLITCQAVKRRLASLDLISFADTSRTNSVEAIKAMRSVILEGLTGQEREEIGARLVFEAFKIPGREAIVCKACVSALARVYTKSHSPSENT
jgi:hypothetical protein